MGTAPTGYQTPKTNWTSADGVTNTDFNRIEGNIQAIEEGSRTIDPAQAPTGNSGSLRQFLDWLANRIKAILGTTNWYDTPPTTLQAAKSHIDAAAPHSGHALASDLAAHLAEKTTHGVGSGYYIAKTSRSDQLPSWNNIPDKPSTFPPSSHSHVGSDISSSASGTPGARKIYLSTADPSGGADGDVWLKYA